MKITNGRKMPAIKKLLIKMEEKNYQTISQYCIPMM